MPRRAVFIRTTHGCWPRPGPRATTTRLWPTRWEMSPKPRRRISSWSATEGLDAHCQWHVPGRHHPRPAYREPESRRRHVHEEVLTFDDFRAADEVFMSGNMMKVTPVTEFDGTHYQAGPVPSGCARCTGTGRCPVPETTSERDRVQARCVRFGVKINASGECDASDR